ncbi:sensor histidine kinase [Isoptericola sp. b408]|uniref:sensor histidine kinase n=1 Tax=Isoptericola sp. b408 TaxID=3064653 RepID=UPI002713FEFF|nr:histidine kinase [Isoptericola sp. b408]MDO8152099.1 histidine kinase [Isoptericola sp. b408]
MTSTPAAPRDTAPAVTSLPGLLRAPWAGATWRGLAQLALGYLWLVSVGLVVFDLVLVAASLVPALGLGLLLLPPALWVARWFATAERARLAAQTGVVLRDPGRRRPTRPGWWGWTTAELADRRGWLATAYTLAGLVVATVFLTLAVAAASGAVAAVVLGARRVSDADPTALWAVPIAVVLAWFAAVLAQLGTLATTALAQAMLGVSPAAEARTAQRAAEAEARAAETDAATARQRAVELTATRAAALEAADAERRRIERDLHDGAQQRLVALGVALGSARRAADRDPSAAVAAVEHAHLEVKETLAELRDLVRGIHPAVLADRGLDDALSALAARSPVPVRVEAGPGLDAVGAGVQAAAYFVVAEALTNVARHAAATRAHVRAAVVPVAEGTDRLLVEVSDDGRGGAEARPGSGLAGLRGRVAALDGTFDLTSPPGAGTRLRVELPCVS